MLKLMQYVNPGVRALRERIAIDTPRPGLLEWLAAPAQWAARRLDLLLMEKRKWTPQPWRHRLRAWRLGFTSFSYSLYELERNPPQDLLGAVAVLAPIALVPVLLVWLASVMLTGYVGLGTMLGTATCRCILPPSRRAARR